MNVFDTQAEDKASSQEPWDKASSQEPWTTVRRPPRRHPAEKKHRRRWLTERHTQTLERKLNVRNLSQCLQSEESKRLQDRGYRFTYLVHDPSLVDAKMVVLRVDNESQRDYLCFSPRPPLASCPPTDGCPQCQLNPCQCGSDQGDGGEDSPGDDGTEPLGA